ncbi:hypothetical protein FO519_001405 [Halicephalobus sp. NKZ332]|nr:hypothetical protein FO519_001405 [Halicephalobus sp. NKZ332]
MRNVIWVLLLISFIESTASSKCVVTKWRDWSECIGNCDFGQRVRNRDVVRPPFPEKDENGLTVVKECPPLYEVEYCVPLRCEENPFTKSNPQVIAASEIKEKSENKTSTTQSSTTAVAKKEFFRPYPKQLLPKPKASGLPVFKNGRRSDCGLADRCCQVFRLICPDGKKPLTVARWYRVKGEPFCRQYHYPFCSDSVEAVENPIYEEAECQETCFDDREKNLLPALRLI